MKKEFEELNAKDQKLLFKALMRAKEERIKQEMKYEAKLWSEIGPDFSIKNLLARLTKDELTEIRQELELVGISNLKKQELIDVLAPAIVNNAVQEVFLLDVEQVSLLTKMLSNKGIINKFNLTDEQLRFFRKRGILFSGSIDGKRVIILSQELVEAFQIINQQQLKKAARANTEWIHLAQGLLFYHGVLEFKELYKFIEKYTKNKIIDDEILIRVLFNAAEYQLQMEPTFLMWSHYSVVEPLKVVGEQKSREWLDYYPFKYEQLLKAGSPEYIDKNFAFKQFTQFLTECYDVPLAKAEEIVEESVDIIKNGESLGEIMEYLQNFFEMDEMEILNLFAAQVVFLMNNTRQWFLKGYTSDELAQKNRNLEQIVKPKLGKVINFPTPKAIDENQTPDKIGRNDQCPCGSGKKYKKCCGKL